MNDSIFSFVEEEDGMITITLKISPENILDSEGINSLHDIYFDSVKEIIRQLNDI
jgi:hypothetical protein